MKMIYKALAATAMLAATTTAANAAVLVGANTYNDGQSFTIYFDGFGGSSPTIMPGLTSNITFTVVSHTNTATASTYNFAFVIDNTSTAPITNSRVGTFGFNLNPNLHSEQNNHISASISSSIFSDVDTGNVPNFGTVDFCGTNTGSCSGNGGNGVDINTPYNQSDAGGTFQLVFDPTTDITMSDFVVRYQSIIGATNGASSAIGRQTTPPPSVPEPATWAMMLFGFGAAGMLMRRNRRKLVAQFA